MISDETDGELLREIANHSLNHVGRDAIGPRPFAALTPERRIVHVLQQFLLALIIRARIVVDSILIFKFDEETVSYKELVGIHIIFFLKLVINFCEELEKSGVELLLWDWKSQIYQSES